MATREQTIGTLVRRLEKMIKLECMEIQRCQFLKESDAAEAARRLERIKFYRKEIQRISA